jgi:hypothetical protein
MPDKESWIKFEDCGQSKSGKTRIWRVMPIGASDVSKPGALLGHVSWYSGWRKYVFAPNVNTVFEQDCLRDLADFCERVTKEHKESRHAG